MTQQATTLKVLAACLFGIGGLVAVPDRSNADEIVAECSLVVDGKEVWNGKCCVTPSVKPSDKLASLYAEGWQACLYRRRHPKNDGLPTYQRKCFGPWINIWQENDQASSKGNNYSAYWSVEGACHGGEIFSARRSGNVYHGDKFIFEWHEVK